MSNLKACGDCVEFCYKNNRETVGTCKPSGDTVHDFTECTYPENYIDIRLKEELAPEVEELAPEVEEVVAEEVTTEACDEVSLIPIEGSFPTEPVADPLPEPVLYKAVTDVAMNETIEEVTIVPEDCEAVCQDPNCKPYKNYKVTSITAEGGITVCLENVWYKIGYAETRQLLNDSTMQEDRKSLWDKVNSECENQYDDLLKSLRTAPVVS